MSKIVWLDRLFWGPGLLVGPTSMAIIAYIAIVEMHKEILSAGTLAGLLSATLAAHTATLNTMSAMCIEGQFCFSIKKLAANRCYLKCFLISSFSGIDSRSSIVFSTCSFVLVLGSTISQSKSRFLPPSRKASKAHSSLTNLGCRT